MELLIVIGLFVVVLAACLALFYGAMWATESRGVRYHINQLLVNVAVWSLNRTQFKCATNNNMLRVVRNEADCLKGCI